MPGLANTLVRANESLSLFPSYGFLDEADRRWMLRVNGWLYETEERWRWKRRLIRWLQRAMRLSPAEERSALFAMRLTPFLVKGGEGRELVVRVGGVDHTLPASTETGHVFGPVPAPPGAFGDVPPNGWAKIGLGDTHGRRFEGRIQLVEPEGLTVVSDLDDTIKFSNVRVRRELLANTFLRPFLAVPGMADRYREWADRGAVFHYVSNSPWQLTPMLAEFLDEQGFPQGSMHLRPFRIRRGGLRRFLKASETYKRAALGELLADFPRRRFILVGDSSELDPEIYGDLYRAHPDRIERIVVRNVTGEDPGDDRIRTAFRDIPRDRWQLFIDANSLVEH